MPVCWELDEKVRHQIEEHCHCRADRLRSNRVAVVGFVSISVDRLQDAAKRCVNQPFLYNELNLVAVFSRDLVPNKCFP